MKKIFLCLIFLLLIVNVHTIYAQVKYEDVVEKIHYTHPNRAMGSHDPFDARKEIGAQNSLLKVYIWGDLNEKYTQKFFKEIFEPLRSKYGQEALFIYNHRAFLMQDNSIRAGMIAECAAKQGQFWDNVLPIIDNSSNLETYGYLRGTNSQELESCLKDPYTRIVIETSENDGKYFGFNSIPTLVIQNTQNPQGYSIKISGTQDLAIFDRAFLEAKEGDLTKKDLTDLKSKVSSLEANVQQAQGQIKEVKEQQSVLAQQIGKINELLQRILQNFRTLLGIKI